MANVREDVAHLRAQYEEARNQGHAIVIRYNDEQIRDGDQLEEHHAAQAPQVDIHLDSDSQKPFFTLVNTLLVILSLRLSLSFECLGHG